MTDRFNKDPILIRSAEAAVDLSPLREGPKPLIGDWIEEAIENARKLPVENDLRSSEEPRKVQPPTKTG